MKELYSLDWEESGEMGLWDQECFSLFPVWIRYFLTPDFMFYSTVVNKGKLKNNYISLQAGIEFKENLSVRFQK